MKQDIITISLIMVTCVFLPFFLLPIINYIEKHRLLLKFRREAANNQLSIKLQESWNQSILGIDPVHNKLLYVQKRNNNFSIEIIDLLQVKDSRLLQITIPSSKYKKQGGLLLRIDLQFIFLTDPCPKILNIYDSRLNLFKEMEFSHAENWNDLIHRFLPTTQFLQKTA